MVQDDYRSPNMISMRTLLDVENAILDIFEKNKITFDGAKTALWQLLAAFYQDELVEDPHRRETIISNIESQKECFLRIFWGRNEDEAGGRLKISTLAR